MYRAKFKGQDITVHNRKLTVGEKFPDFKLLAPDFTTVTLNSFKDKKKIIYTVPSIETTICSEQTERLQNYVSSKADTVEITVSVDLPYALQRWCGLIFNKNGFVLSDYYNHQFGKDCGVFIEENHLLHRALFYVDENNIIKYVDYTENANDEIDVNKLFEYINEE